MLVSGQTALSSLLSLGSAGAAQPAASAGNTGTSFLSMVDSALQSVSTDQNTASQAESAFSVGAPGATLGKALVASDRAQIAWNATVSVRNELVSAYQSVMNMNF